MQLFIHSATTTKLICNQLAGDALEQTAHPREVSKAAHMPYPTSVTQGTQHQEKRWGFAKPLFSK